MRAWPLSHPVFSIAWVMRPAATPSTIAAMKNDSAKGNPNKPVDRTSSSGLVNGEDTMNATIGAHGTLLAIAPSTTAVVPQEQNGVRVARTTAPATAYTIRLRSQSAIRSAPM